MYMHGNFRLVRQTSALETYYRIEFTEFTHSYVLQVLADV